MAVKKYEKNTTHAHATGVDDACGCIPGVPNFVNKFTIVNSVNGMTGDVVLDLNSTYVYEQTSAASEWTITHSLGRYPSVTVVDSAGSVVVGDVLYTSKNQIILTFQGAFSGTAYLN